MKKRIIICGADGKMGKALFNRIKDSEEFNPVCGVDKFPKAENGFCIYNNLYSVTEKADYIIDFSSPALLDEILEFSKQRKVKLVLATTGYSACDYAKIIKASENNAIFISQNMSLGFNLLVGAVNKLIKPLKDFDVEIIEKHHGNKLDSPSGSALMIYNSIVKSNPEKYSVCGRKGKSLRNKNEIGIHSVRGGTIVGEHQVLFLGDDEVITITHQANSRNVFVSGALSAVNFIQNKKKGLFSFDDLLRQKYGYK